MNIGDHDGGDLGDIYAFTNCDYIELYKNHEFIKTFSPSKTSALKHPPIVIDDFIGDQLEKNEGVSKRDAALIKKVIKAAASQGFNLPLKEKASMGMLLIKNKMTLDDGVALFGKYYAGWGQSQRVYTFKGFKDKEQVIEVERGPFEKISLKAEPSKTILTNEETYDVALVSLKVESDLGEVLPYHDEVITLSVTGNLSILGPMQFALSGGRSGFYVRSQRGEGSGMVTINTQSLGTHDIEFKIYDGEQLHL